MLSERLSLLSGYIFKYIILCILYLEQEDI